MSTYVAPKCDIKFRDGANYSGPSSVWADRSPNLANIGDGWSNRATSFKLS